jgi:hypothetical protein
MNDKRKIAKRIIDFGFEYGLFSEDENYKKLVDKVEQELEDIYFLENLNTVIEDKISLNKKYINKNKELYKLKDSILEEIRGLEREQEC